MISRTFTAELACLRVTAHSKVAQPTLCIAPDTEHWGLEKWLYEHLLAVHVEKELCEIYTKFCSSEVAHRQMWLLAYYMAAVREKEREHMPLIGPSVDRRSLAYVNQICQSKNVEALMCFTCGQIHTHVACWDRL